jgi:hypothetical protein
MSPNATITAPPATTQRSILRERMQQRRQSSQTGEINLAAVAGDDDESVYSRSSQRGTMSTAVRDRLSLLRAKVSVPSTKGTGDDALLLQLAQKVRQLEREKEHMASKQIELRNQHEMEQAKLKEKVRELSTSESTPGDGTRDRTTIEPTTAAMSELQTKLNMAMMKISRLEEEQKRHDDLQDNYQDAQVASVNLQMNSLQARSFDSADVTDAVSVWSGASASDEKEAEHSHVEGQSRRQAKENGDGESPSSATGIPYHTGSASVNTMFTTSTSDTSILGETDSQARAEKVRKLKAYMRRRESQLKELVLDNQSSPTDVQAVIQNLQDELNAAKKIMSEQKQALIIAQMEIKLMTPSAQGDDDSTKSDLTDWKERYRDLQSRYIQLEINRAWGEFKLRDRITNDGLKFHGRLRHWKEQTEELQQQLEETMGNYAEERRELRQKLLDKETAFVTMENEFESYKSGMQHTLEAYMATKERLAKLREQVATDLPVQSSDDSPESLHQAQLLQAALDRKGDRSSAWPSRWIGKTLGKISAADSSAAV